jgi:hypothetical protein
MSLRSGFVASNGIGDPFARTVGLCVSFALSASTSRTSTKMRTAPVGISAVDAGRTTESGNVLKTYRRHMFVLDAEPRATIPTMPERDIAATATIGPEGGRANGLYVRHGSLL